MNRILRNQPQLLSGFMAAVIFFIIDDFLDHLMLHISSANVALEISDAITALLIGALVAHMAVLYRQREAYAQARVERIAEMNTTSETHCR